MAFIFDGFGTAQAPPVMDGDEPVISDARAAAKAATAARLAVMRSAPTVAQAVASAQAQTAALTAAGASEAEAAAAMAAQRQQAATQAAQEANTRREVAAAVAREAAASQAATSGPPAIMARVEAARVEDQVRYAANNAVAQRTAEVAAAAGLTSTQQALAVRQAAETGVAMSVPVIVPSDTSPGFLAAKQGGLGGPLVAAGAGFLAAGPLGAAIGAGLAYFLTRKGNVTPPTPWMNQK